MILKELIKKLWYIILDLSRHLYNDIKLFKKLQQIYINFITTTRQTILIKQNKIIIVSFLTRKFIELSNIVLVKECNSNLISSN